MSQSEQQLLQSLTKKRGHVKSRLTRFKTFVNSFDEGRHTVTQLKTRLELIEDSFKEFENIQSEIETLDSSGDQCNQREIFEEDYIETVALAKDLIQNSTRSTSDQQVQSASVRHDTRLPDIPLCTFAGDYREWPGFFDNFCSLVHNNPHLSKSRKLYYLKSSLKDEAADVIISYKTSDENYDTAFELLKKTYSNDKLIKKAHVSSLFNISRIEVESLQGLRKFLNEINKHLKALENLGEDTNNSCVALILVHLFVSKLDKASEREWETRYAVKTETSLQDFVDFLSERCNVLQNIESSREICNSLSNSNDKFKKRKEGKRHEFNKKACNQTSLVTSKQSSTNQSLNCYFCKGAHSVYKCRNLLKVPAKSRLEEIKKLKLCTNCLRPGHSTSACESSTCRYCHKRHNSILHVEEEEEVYTSSVLKNETANVAMEIKGSSVSNDDQSDKQVAPYTLHSSAGNLPLILLSTALIDIIDQNGKKSTARALLDSGSQSNFMTLQMFKKLGLTGHKVKSSITGIGQASMNIKTSTQAEIKSRYNNYSQKLSFLIIEKITDRIPYNSFDKTVLNIPNNITLADPTFNYSNEIDILIGAGTFWDLLCVGQINSGVDKPVLQKSKLGWIVSGTIPINKSTITSSCNVTNDINSQLEKFWEIENFDQKVNYTPEEIECERNFRETTRRNANGRFIINLPMRTNEIDFGNSRELSKKRFEHLEKKFRVNPKLKEKYVDFMEEYKKLGHMSKIENDESTKNIIYYLPHHGVLKESSLTTKLRVVFDASMKTEKNLSLNQMLLTGPTIQNDLFSIVVRFRLHQFVIIADVAKMYRQILVTETQQDMQRIFWRTSEDEPLEEYKLNTLTYGTAPASFIATRCLQELADQFEERYPDASGVIRNDFYMDDLLTGAESVERARQLKNEVSLILETGCFQLRKWMSNKMDILKDLQSEEKGSQYIIADDSKIKTLGVLWDAETDKLQITCSMKETTRVTKRTILSSIAQIFDPLGLVGPITIKGKILLQQIWQLQLEWDESVPEKIYTEWNQLRKQLHILNQITIPRCISKQNAISIQIHGFCDASLSAYGACLYLRSENASGEILNQLICAKSRVAPIKTLTIPRLELNAALLLAELTDKVVKSLNLNLHQITYWSDSKIVLAWLAAQPNQWKLFVANRVAEIQRLTNRQNWKHVSSVDNPADIISRGCMPETLLNSSIWWQGPKWLRQPVELWPSTKENAESKRDIKEFPEYAGPKVVACVSTPDTDIFRRYSSLMKLQRVLAYCFRFKDNSTIKSNRLTGSLTVSELQNSMKVLIKLCQEIEFSAEIKCLKLKRNIPAKSRLSSLNPFLDEKNIMRVGGRISKADVNYDHKYPIILPNGHPLTNLIIQNEHIRNFHSGPQLTLSLVRLKYWPLKGRSTIRKFIHNCIICFKAQPRIYYPKMADLPKHRVQIERPFYNCGVDYAGPFSIRDGKGRTRKIVKCYLCIFVCFATRAVHLELAGDLSTESFLNTLKRFIARRGICKNLYCDNGTNFVGAKNELKEIFEFLRKTYSESSVNRFLTDNRITWHFLPPRSPHMGGLWEAAVKSAKYHSRRIIGNANLTFEGLSTVFAQIESILNSRPLTPLSNDPHDFNPLTPSHFLIGDVATAIPEVDVQDVPINRLSHHQKLQQLLQHFWNRWRSEYLSTLQQRTKWKSQPNQQPMVGDMVIIKMDNTPPMHWPMGRVSELHPGDDSIVRVVSVRTVSGVMKRAVSKLCFLPIESEA